LRSELLQAPVHGHVTSTTKRDDIVVGVVQRVVVKVVPIDCGFITELAFAKQLAPLGSIPA
jgi:hypothetical protein